MLIVSGPTNSWGLEVDDEWLHAPLLMSGDILIKDVLTSQRSALVLEKIRASGVEVRFVPLCPRDPNPIEQIFCEIKFHQRRIAARTEKTLENPIAKASDAVAPGD